MHKWYSKFFSVREAKKLIKLGIPVYIAQISGIGMNFVDLVMTGQASADDMAAVAVASSLWHPISLFGIGVLLSLTALSAQLVGEGKAHETPNLLRQGIFCGFLLAVPLMLILYILSFNMAHFGLNGHLEELASGYLRAILWGLPGWFLFINIRSLFEGFSRTRPAMVISIFVLLLNIPANYILIYGKFGFPAMGAVGSGIATVFCLWAMALSMIYIACKDKDLKAYGALFKPIFVRDTAQKLVHWSIIRRIFRIGVPGAMALFFEVSMFAVSALLLAPFGSIVISGHQLAMNFSGILYMIPLSISLTCTMSVSYYLGAGQWVHARLAAWTSLILSLVFGVFNSTFTIIFREQIALMYNDTPEVVSLASSLLIFAATFQLLDATMVTGLGVLRGHNDTKAISYISLLSYWVVGFPLGYVLGRTDLIVKMMGAQGFWISYICALAMGGLLFWGRIIYLQKLDGASLRERISR